jgi:hypothetical protein
MIFTAPLIFKKFIKHFSSGEQQQQESGKMVR